MTLHRIQISSADESGSYAVHGAIALVSKTPVLCAARALLAAAADPRDTIAASFAGCTIAPASIGAILRPRAEMRNSDVKRLLAAGRF